MRIPSRFRRTFQIWAYLLFTFALALVLIKFLYPNIHPLEFFSNKIASSSSGVAEAVGLKSSSSSSTPVAVIDKYLEDSMYNKFDDQKLEDLKQKLSIAIPEIRKVSLSGSNKSFTINKEHIFICTKDEKGQYYSDNMLVYVLLHELAHVQCDEIGHTAKFTRIFKELLDRAENAGLYNSKIEPIKNYCEY